jgi:uncharacterized Ntn-hydrolase superfamily protein
LIKDTFSVAGNMLAGPQVIKRTAEAFAAGAHLPLPQRFLAALEAGEAAGGDKRGRQSAAMLIHDEEEYAFLDIRVDDHPDPLAELTRLEQVARGRPAHYRKCMPSRHNPAGVFDRTEIERRIAEAMARESGIVLPASVPAQGADPAGLPTAPTRSHVPENGKRT